MPSLPCLRKPSIDTYLKQSTYNIHSISMIIYFNIILSFIPIYSKGHPSCSLYRFIISPMFVACSAHLITRHFVIIMSEYEYKLWTYSLRSFLQPPFIRFLLGPIIFHIKFLWGHLNLRPSVSSDATYFN